MFGVLDEPEWESVAGALKLRMLEAATPLLPDSTGGALLLGVNGVCIISHGASSATAIVNAVRVAVRVRHCRCDRPAHRGGARVERRRRVAMPAETHSHRGPIDQLEIERIVREQLSEILEVDPDAITADARLRDDLDADDYALIELVEAVEGELGERMVGLKIDDEDLAEWQTVRDAIECVAAGLDAAVSEPVVPEPAVPESAVPESGSGS